MNTEGVRVWPSPHQVLKKISLLRQFNELQTRERLGNDGIIMLDNGGKITFASAKTVGLLGYDPQELLGRTLPELAVEESYGTIEKLLLSSGSVERWRRDELVLVDKSRARVPVMVTSTNLFRRGDQAGSLLVIADLRDREDLVEDLKDVQTSLRDSSLELSKKLWEVSVMKEVAHTLQTTQDLNEMLRIILTGVTAEQGLGFNRAFLLLLDEQVGHLKGSLAVGPSNYGEAERIWVELKHESHTLKELLEMHRDTSGQFDQEINEIVRRMQFDLAGEVGIVARSVLEGVHFNIAQAHQDDRVDGQLLELLGTEAFVIVPIIARGRPLGAIIADNCFTRRPIEEADVELLRTLATHAGFAIERANLYEQLTKKVRELERAYRSLQESQEQLLRAERLSAVGKMAARLAHEIRNPTTSLGGFVRIMSRELPPDDPNQEYLKVIIEEVARLEKLLTEVLDFTKPAEPAFEMADLNEAVRKVLVLMQPEAEKRRITVEEDLCAELPRVSLDPVQMGQAVINVVRNGLEAMSPEGKLTVRTMIADGKVRLEIEDTGVGIPQENLSKLFSEFFTTKSAGVGLGLVVAYQTVKNHRGSVDVKSEEGKGTVFRIDLPGEAAEKRIED